MLFKVSFDEEISSVFVGDAGTTTTGCVRGCCCGRTEFKVDSATFSSFVVVVVVVVSMMMMMMMMMTVFVVLKEEDEQKRVPVVYYSTAAAKVQREV
jgi:hypothetical protein